MTALLKTIEHSKHTSEMKTWTRSKSPAPETPALEKKWKLGEIGTSYK